MSNVEDILKERQKTHGDFRAHAGLCQSLKAMCALNPGWPTMSSAQREAIDMILHKIARAIVGNANHIDHWDDIQGYAKLVSDELSTSALKVNEDGVERLLSPPALKVNEDGV